MKNTFNASNVVNSISSSVSKSSKNDSLENELTFSQSSPENDNNNQIGK